MKRRRDDEEDEDEQEDRSRMWKGDSDDKNGTYEEGPGDREE